MSYNNLIIFLTDRCRSGCSTCNVRAIPENSGMLRSSELDTIFTGPIVSGDIGKYIIWTGGEPFENFSVLEYGISIGGKNGFRSEILSSGYWFEEAPELLERLTKKGDFSLRISIDSEHLDFVRDNIILMLMKECIDKKIELNFTVRDIPGDVSSVEIFNKVKKKFPVYAGERADDPRWIHHIPHVPLNGNDPYKTGITSISYNSGCKMVFRDLVAGWDGNLYPCCGLFSLPGYKKYSTGSLTQQNGEGWKFENASALFKMIGDKGPYGIFQEFGSNEALKEIPGFRNQCHACLHFLSKYNGLLEEYLTL